jgi:hypothetical protein
MEPSVISIFAPVTMHMLLSAFGATLLRFYFADAPLLLGVLRNLGCKYILIAMLCTSSYVLHVVYQIIYLCQPQKWTNII